MKDKLPKSVYNWISLIGVTIAIISLFMIIFLFAISILIEQQSSYLGLIIFILLPSFLVLGLILIPVGMLISRKRRPRSEEFKLPYVDLNNTRHRNAFIIFSVGTVIFLFLSAIGSYEAFHYSESVEFCGTICHTVMEPEYVAYQNSAHARVTCAECHVGTGADWFVKSKLSGLYQVYAVITDVYPRPIETPIANLRPARETCEKCHWPQKFYARKLRTEKHFLTDEKNTPWDISMVMKIGSDHSSSALQEGIHWHINPDVKIEYAATDFKLNNIPWVKYTNKKTGESKIFRDGDTNDDDLNLDSLTVKTMDCMDCHNRPSHNYLPPSLFVNNEMAAGRISASLPEIKSKLMELCETEFGNKDSANLFIKNEITNFYKEDYPNIYAEKLNEIEETTTNFMSAYSKNIFPEMKVRWSHYPTHIGHLEFDGCFRCHNDTHATEDGEVISNDCNLCHVIVGQGTEDDFVFANINEPLEFKHPVDIEEAWKESLCTDCHTGLNP
ncbi:MAG: NapC/NirT family cytochrome c [Melioribacteraceae bacterium]|nr:NapC/NirT family cytochrome c [Melioribacteraceae bacterium]